MKVVSLRTWKTFLLGWGWWECGGGGTHPADGEGLGAVGYAVLDEGVG